MSLRFNGASMLLITWLLTWLLITVWGTELCEPIDPEAIPVPPFWKPQTMKRDLQFYRSHIQHYDKCPNEDDDGEGGEGIVEASPTDWRDRKEHRLHIQMTNLEEEEQQDQKKDMQIKQALLKMMNEKFSDNKLPTVSKHPQIAPGLDLRLEFASDESNPYIENTRSRHAPLD